MMTPRVIRAAALIAIVGCHNAASTPTTTAPAAAASAPASGATTSSPGAPAPIRRDVLISTGASFSPQRGDSALRAFVPAVAAQESGGECSTTRTTGSGATVVIAYFPTRTKAVMQANITFDSAGRLVRYNERRGVLDMSAAKGLKIEQVDSLLRAQEAKTRSTTVSLDYAIDQGMAINRGGSLPFAAIIGTVREIERLEQLGPITARLDRVRKLCGV